jgi:dUTPase
MSDNFFDVRTKVGEREHAVLSAIAHAQDKEISFVVRQVVEKFVDDELHKVQIINNFLRGKGGVGSAGE